MDITDKLHELEDAHRWSAAWKRAAKWEWKGRKLLTNQVQPWFNRVEAAEARVKELERVLEQVEWVHGMVRTYCPWCHGEWTDHLENCPRQAALRGEEEDLQ